MVERIEVLRDGASAVYGADAIAGVINFITKNNMKVSVSAAVYSNPKKKGGRIRCLYLWWLWQLRRTRFNVYGAISYQKSKEIMAKDRKVSRRGGLLPELGIDAGSANGFPANLYDPTSGVY